MDRQLYDLGLAYIKVYLRYRTEYLAMKDKACSFNSIDYEKDKIQSSNLSELGNKVATYVDYNNIIQKAFVVDKVINQLDIDEPSMLLDSFDLEYRYDDIIQMQEMNHKKSRLVEQVVSELLGDAIKLPLKEV